MVKNRLIKWATHFPDYYTSKLADLLPATAGLMTINSSVTWPPARQSRRRLKRLTAYWSGKQRPPWDSRGGRCEGGLSQMGFEAVDADDLFAATDRQPEKFPGPAKHLIGPRRGATGAGWSRHAARTHVWLLGELLVDWLPPQHKREVWWPAA
jgi:hypothetical protein